VPAPCILLADDSSTVRAIARMELDTAGYTVVEAADGEQALALAIERQPDVILLDIEMPVMDGYETVVALKADLRTADIPVVFLTGRTDAADVVRALKLGGHDYVRKPPEPAELLARVRAALRVKSLQDELRSRALELDTMTRTDHLTTLFNRRHMEECLRALTAGASRHGYPVVVLIVDVDHFKTVNDTLGHQAGDEVLVELSRRLRSVMRTEDVLGRWGGEEFLLLLPHTTAAQAAFLAERLRAVVSSQPVPTSVGDLPVSISIGGAAAEVSGHHDLLLTADRELYSAKDAGRNRVHIVRADPLVP
jgi:two-component system cell cycle response regulator